MKKERSKPAFQANITITQNDPVEIAEWMSAQTNLTRSIKQLIMGYVAMNGIIDLEYENFVQKNPKPVSINRLVDKQEIMPDEKNDIETKDNMVDESNKSTDEDDYTLLNDSVTVDYKR